MKSPERGPNEVHVKCAAAEVYRTEAYRCVDNEYADNFSKWTLCNEFRNSEHIGGGVWKLKEGSLYALYRKFIIKATEFGGNYRGTLTRCGADSAECVQLPEGAIDSIVPYLKHAIEFKLNLDVGNVPMGGVDFIEPSTNAYAHGLL